MASLASPLRALLPAQTPPTTLHGRRRRDARERVEHSEIAGAIAIAGAANAVAQRTKVFRRALISADVISAAFALTLSVQLLGDDFLRSTTLLALPMVVVISKLIGLYDRDELLLEKRTIDEAPTLFQLATVFTLLTWLAERQLITGHFGKDQVLGIW